MFFLLKWLLYVGGTGAALTGGLASYLAFLQPSFYFPKPTGQYAVGISTHHLVDEYRNGGKGKELMIDIWYPAEGAMPVKPTAPFAPYLVNYFKKNQKLTWLSFVSRSMYTYAIRGLPLLQNGEQFPVIIYSHGLGGTKNHNTAQSEELASNGYVVVGISHSKYAGLIQFPDGRLEGLFTAPQDEQKSFFDDPMKQFKIFNDDISIWVDDVQMVLEKLEQRVVDKKSSLHGRLDLNYIGMFGHSYGGEAAVQLCRLEPRIKAGVDLDGAMFGENITAPFDKPIMFLLQQEVSEVDFIALVKKSGMKQAEEYAKASYERYFPAINKLAQAIGHDVYKINVQGAEHAAFCSIALLKEAQLLSRPLGNFGVGTINGFRATEIVNAHLVAFFNKYLKGKPSELLDGDAKLYPECVMEKW